MASLSQIHGDTFVVKGGLATRADKLAETNAPAGPETLSPAAEAWQKRAQVAKDMFDSEVTGYISQWEGEEDSEYATRKANSVYGFVNFYEEAANGLIDQVFAKPLQLEEAPPQIEEFFENVERRKRAPVDGTQFFRKGAQTEIAYGGNPLILISHAPGVEAADKAEEDAQGVGPFLCLIHPWSIIDVTEDEDGNLEQVRYVSNTTVRDADGFGSNTVYRIIALERGEVGGFSKRRVFVWSDKDKKYVEDADQERPFDPGAVSADIKAKFREIPVVEMADWWSEPKLRNVALLNVLHLRKRTDYDVAMSVASVPMRAFYGFSAPDMVAAEFGPFRFLRTDKSKTEAGTEDISFGFDTSTNARDDLTSVERYISIKSKDPQSQRATGEEKSTIRMMEEAKVKSRLQAWATRWLNAFQASLDWSAAWMGLDSAGRLSYLPEVFNALSIAPTWKDFDEFMRTVIDSDPALWEWQIAEAKRYGLIADDKPTDELLAMFEAAAAGGGLDDVDPDDGGVDADGE